MKIGLFSCLLATAAAGWSPNRLHHVDTIGEGHLFRGSAPVVNGTFAFDALRTQMQIMAKKEANVTVPDDFILIVISMLDKIKSSEKAELQAEQDWFSTIPDGTAQPGSQLIHWPIIGDLVSPSTYPKSLCRSRAKGYANDGDKMPPKIIQTHGMLAGAASTTVVYFHCDAGMDRTGEFYGDYSMMYRNQTYKEVLTYDDSIEGVPPAGRKINTPNKQALEWMCIFLLETGVTDPACNMCT
jgi:hypothetical protein